MITIWKFSFMIQDFFTMVMPVGAEILYVGSQEGKGCIWARVDTDALTEKRQFKLVETGHPLNPECALDYVGTFETRRYRSDINLVWHLFEFSKKGKRL